MSCITIVSDEPQTVQGFWRTVIRNGKAYPLMQYSAVFERVNGKHQRVHNSNELTYKMNKQECEKTE